MKHTYRGWFISTSRTKDVLQAVKGDRTINAGTKEELHQKIDQIEFQKMKEEIKHETD